MAAPAPTVETLFEAAKIRISCYQLSPKSPIPDSRIHEIVSTTIKHAPSSFNVQSARAVILLKDDNKLLWNDITDRSLEAALSEDTRKGVAKMAQGFKTSYGTVLWFEDEQALDELAARNPLFGHLVPEWGEASSGMHQFLVWTALELEGLGCNLQHFNFMQEFTDAIMKQWDLPKTWKLKSQLIFGTPTEGLVRKKERTYAPVEERVKVFGG